MGGTAFAAAAPVLRRLRMGIIEDHLKDCASLRDDISKSAKARRVARVSIEICHGVIDLKEENKRLRAQVEEPRAKKCTKLKIVK